MPDTYSQMPTHVVMAVKYRQALVQPGWNADLHKYITGIVSNQGLRMLQINSMPDHLHMLIEMRPNFRLSDVMRTVKADSTRWINQQRYTRSHFQWQEGFGAFNLSRRGVPAVAAYIRNQQAHHGKESFGKEIIRIYRQEEIEYDPRFLFADPL